MGGGNFWQGAGTGLIIAGFNHLMHDGRKKRNINNEVDKKYGGNAYSAAPVTQATVDEMLNGLPTLNDMYENSQGLNIYANNNIDVTQSGAEAIYYTNIEGATNASGGHGVQLYRKSFTSYRHLAHNIVHEFGHAFSKLNGTFASNYAITRNNWSKAIALDEIFAYHFAAEFGVPYSYGYREARVFLGLSK